MNNMQNNNKTQITLEGLSSAIVNIHKSTLDFIERVSQRIEKGDYLGAVLQLTIAIEVLLFATYPFVCIVALVLKSRGPAFWLIPTMICSLGLVILLAILFRRPDDKRLARGQGMRVNVISPTSLYKAS